MPDIHSILYQYWGFQKFRPLQEEVIHSVLAGKDTLALMPTGGGKSLCYQVPALAQEGMCLVVSPLIALMKDQVEGLRRKGITAYSIQSGMTRKEIIHILKVVTESNCKFLFVSPERLETTLFKEYLPGMFINLIAVDEAHCISQWGYDFRPSYLKIAALRKELPDVPVLALTASATEEVQNDICDKLEFPKKLIFRQSFERPNLSYSVFKVDIKQGKIIDIIKRIPGSGIVYCKTRKKSKDICELLQMEGISADYYHAGLTYKERNKRQEDWVKGAIKVIVCTNAFGMGIDKPDVRTVIHADAPDCLESYYQEAGRAGRDGKTSFAVLLHNSKDLEELGDLPAQRFPSITDIRTVYQSISNYLQIPVGGGEGQYYDFDLVDFIRKFKFNSNVALYSLKALEQEGYWTFSEQLFLAATVRFTTDKDYLYTFEKSNPQYEFLIKTLLRAYEGVFDFPVSFSEKLPASMMKKDAEEVKKQLLELHRMGIIEYTPQKDTPQLFLLRGRIKTEDIYINSVSYSKRKEKLQHRVNQIIKYIKEDKECRSRILASYFGDHTVKPCGICDNCLRQKGSVLNKEEFEAIHHRIMNIVKYESLPVKELLVKLSGVKEEKAWKVIRFLESEQKITMNNEGWVVLK
jgi:ATP-dependent DNA helicase RecQ